MAKKNKKELVVKKPNQTVMISNGEITATQRKSYNILLHKAQQDLRINNNQMTFLISIAEIEDKAGIQDTNNKRLKEDLKALMKITVSCVHERGNWVEFVLLSQVRKEGKLLQFAFPPMIVEALIKDEYYTTLDLMILKTLTGKYAIIFYELAMRYQKVEIPKLDIDEFRALTGTEDYRDFSNLRQKVIEPGLEEINEKSDIIMDYKTFIVGRKVVALKFMVKQKPQIVLDPEPPAAPKPDSDPCTLIPLEHRDKKTVQKLVDRYFKTHGADYVKRNIEYANQNAKKNYRSYLNQALELDWGLGLQEDQEQNQKFNIKLNEGMIVEFSDGRQFKIESGNCIHPNGYEGGCIPEGMIIQEIRKGRIKVIG